MSEALTRDTYSMAEWTAAQIRILNSRQFGKRAEALAEFERFRRSVAESKSEESTTRWRGLKALFDSAIVMERPDKARETLLRMVSAGGQLDQNQRAFRESEVWLARAALAKLERRKADVAAHLVRAFEAVPADIAPALRGRIRSQALSMWKEIGGSEEGFASLRPAVAESDDTKWKVVQRVMPPLQGVRFEGKTTFVNVWATWCGPCQAELPQVQRLHEMFRDRKDVAVITLNIDENPGLVEPYMKQRGFQFAVEFAREIVERDLKVETIPRNWIIDRKGVMRLERGAVMGEALVDDVAAAIQRVANSADPR